MAMSCSKAVLNEPPLGYSFLPKQIDLDTIGPKITAAMDPSTDTSLQDFVSIPLGQGRFINSKTKDSLNIPRGVLISDKKAAMYIFYKSEHDRLTTQVKYSNYLMGEYYSSAKAAEILYQKKIADLTKSNQRSWLEQNVGYLGFMLGIASTILTEYMVVKVK